MTCLDGSALSLQLTGKDKFKVESYFPINEMRSSKTVVGFIQRNQSTVRLLSRLKT